MQIDLGSLANGIPYEKMTYSLDLDQSVPHAPARNSNLTASEFSQAIKNALRYFLKTTTAG